MVGRGPSHEASRLTPEAAKQTGERAMMLKASLALNRLKRSAQEDASDELYRTEKFQRDMRMLLDLESDIDMGQLSLKTILDKDYRLNDPHLNERVQGIIGELRSSAQEAQERISNPDTLEQAAPERLDNVVPFEQPDVAEQEVARAVERRDAELEAYIGQMLGYYEKLFDAIKPRETFPGQDGESFDPFVLDRALQNTPGEFAQDVRRGFGDKALRGSPTELILRTVLLQQIDSTGQKMSERLGVAFDDAKLSALKREALRRLNLSEKGVEAYLDAA